MTLIDISPVISEKTAVWPGDTPLTRNVLSNIDAGSNIDLSSFHGTVHLGAHADAPRHYSKAGPSIEAVALDPYIGICYVHRVEKKHLITREDCQTPLNLGAKRVLFRTDTFPDPDIFNQDFCSFTPEALEYLGRAGVVLVGIDTPSIDPFDSKQLPAHHMLGKYNMRNLEGLVLSAVSDGFYELIALPLPLKGFDASPVRAVLRTLESGKI